MKSNIKQIPLYLAVLMLLLSPLACAQSYTSAAELTATAFVGTQISLPRTASATDTPSTPTMVPTNTQYPTPTLPVIQTSPTITLTPSPTPLPTFPSGTQPLSVIYYSQSGDTVPAVALRFNVNPGDISSEVALPATGLLEPSTLLVIPNQLTNFGPSKVSFPDSEVVFAPSVLGFSTKDYLSTTSGYLKTYQEYVNNWLDGAGIIDKIALENSINPRLLLALIEQQSHWVLGSPTTWDQTLYPMGYINVESKGLYHQLKWAVSQLSIGYYGWRAGILTSATLPDNTQVHLAPNLNAGTAAIQILFSKLAKDKSTWEVALEGDGSITATYEKLFGSPWLKAFEPLYPTNLTQPPMELPFAPGHTWSFTGGPHSAWGPEGALSALDFAPPTGEKGCAPSQDWITASAPGMIVRSADGVVVLDLDGDGYEQTGWDIMYLHVATVGRVTVGTFVKVNDLIGHASCEGGEATGSHVHIVRKFNGEWILADGAVPFVLSGWTVHKGSIPYEGTLTKGDQLVTSSLVGSFQSLVTRPSSP